MDLGLAKVRFAYSALYIFTHLIFLKIINLVLLSPVSIHVRLHAFNHIFLASVLLYSSEHH